LGYVYILHFDKPYKHAAHYIGYAIKDWEARIDEHRRGISRVRIMEVIKAAGIGFEVAKVFKRVPKTFERKLKNRHGASKICPICKKNNHGKTIHSKNQQKPPLGGNETLV
jgi:predicted GIY-YIG superfamily endonuclease